MPGRRPKPTKLKLLQGNPGHRPLNTNEPEYKVEIPKPPKHLNKVALQEWKRVSKVLFEQGLLTTVDMAGLAAYCQSFSRWAAAETQLEKEGLTDTTTNGNTIQNTLVGIANQAMEHMRKHLIEFGMTPSSRSKVTAQDTKQEKDPWSKFG